MISQNPFTNKDAIPDYDQLKEILGDSMNLWNALKFYMKEEIGVIHENWKFYSAKYGWTMKNMLKKRNIFFFTPYPDYFKVSFIFGDKAVAVAEQSTLPESVVKKLMNAKKYMEGRGISIDVKNAEDIEIIKKLIQIKVNN